METHWEAHSRLCGTWWVSYTQYGDKDEDACGGERLKKAPLTLLWWKILIKLYSQEIFVVSSHRLFDKDNNESREGSLSQVTKEQAQHCSCKENSSVTKQIRGPRQHAYVSLDKSHNFLGFPFFMCKSNIILFVLIHLILKVPSISKYLSFILLL